MAEGDKFYSIPKGTRLLVGRAWGDDNLEEKVLDRAVRCKLDVVNEIFYYRPAEQIAAYLGMRAQQEQLPRGNRAKFKVTSSLGRYGDYPNYKFVDLKFATEVAAPKKPETRKETGPTLRQRMVQGSKWKLTHPVEIQKPVQVRRQTTNTHGPKSWYIDTEYQPDYEIPAGEEVEVVSKKMSTSRPGQWLDGLYLDIKWNEKTIRFVQFSQFKNPEQVGKAEIVPIFCIRDSVTGEFFKETTWDWDRSKGGRTNQEVVMVDKLTQAKKWNRLSDVRSATLELTGYYYELPGAENLPEWMGHAAEVNYKDVPRTWEIVKIDKLTKNVVETIELLDTLDRQWRLRDLTVKYGSGVRTAYSDLEKKGKLGEFSAMLVFSIPQTQRADRRWDDEGMTDAEQAEVKACLDMFDKSDVKRGKGRNEYAIAVKDVTTAMMIKLQYSGELECHLLDLNTLAEVVQEG